MKREITEDNYNLLFAMFQLYALQVTLDDIETNSVFVRKFKQQTNQYTKYLKKEILTVLNQLYDIDYKEFNVMDETIYQNAREFGRKGFSEFFIIKD